jgi:hypothetical protein
MEYGIWDMRYGISGGKLVTVYCILYILLVYWCGHTVYCIPVGVCDVCVGVCVYTTLLLSLYICLCIYVYSYLYVCV